MAGSATADQALQARRVSPQERASNFARATRKYEQVAPTQTRNAGETMRFQLDKVRLSARIKLLVEVVLTATHASSTSYTPAYLAPYTLLRNIRLTTNMSFTPWISSGVGAFLEMISDSFGPNLQMPVYGNGTPTSAQTRAWTYQGQQSAAGGTANTVAFELDFPFVVNERDPIGLIMTQNQETTVNLDIDLGSAVDLVASGQSGFTFTIGSITITPLVETFSIPQVGEAIPDITIVKQVGEENVNTTANRFIYRIPTGPTYRKLLFMLTDNAGLPIDDATLTGPFELTVNTSDIVTRYPAKLLSRRNAEQYGFALPRGVWAFDWTFQGLANYGGSRDYVDTERLTELWLTIQGPAAYNLKVVYETLSRMGG